MALPQSPIRGISHTLDVVCDLPSLWDCRIKQLLVENPEMVSVQVNEEFAEREDWDSIQIKEDDKVDFLYFMGGGAL